jgi:hypothetical protein
MKGYAQKYLRQSTSNSNTFLRRIISIQIAKSDFEIGRVNKTSTDIENFRLKGVENADGPSFFFD